MKKLYWGIIILISIVVSIGIYTFLPQFKFNLEECSEPVASKILYSYLLQDFGMRSKELNEYLKITPENVLAIEYDLNEDRENEIIGIVYSSYYYGSMVGFHLFILQKQNGVYNDISNVGHESAAGEVIILKKKKNQYYRLILTKKNVCEFNNKNISYNYAYTLNIIGFIRNRLWLWSLEQKR